MLSNETGNLAYYQEGVIGKEQHVAGAVVIPCALKKTPMGVYYTQYPIIRNVDQARPVAFLKKYLI